MLLVLAAFLGGYYLGNEPVSHLTQSVNGLTIELDAMRNRMASPAAEAPQEGTAKATEELHVINEGIAAVRADLADQKVLLEKASAVPVEVAGADPAELLKARSDLQECQADKLDLQARCNAAAVRSVLPTAPAAGAAAPTAPVAPATPNINQAPGYRYQPYGVPR